MVDMSQMKQMAKRYLPSGMKQMVKRFLPSGQQHISSAQAEQMMTQLAEYKAETEQLRTQLAEYKPEAQCRPTLVAEPWMIEAIRVDDETLELSGWALPPVRKTARARLEINGHAFTDCTYPIERADVGGTFWQREQARQSGYSCRARGSRKKLFPDGCAVLEFDYPGHPKQFWFHHAWFLQDPCLRGILPDDQRRYRVIGSNNADMFCLGGFTDFRRMELLLENLFGRSYTHFPKILDWGCGCGRVARYFGSVPNISFTGIDVDRDNIGWCAANLGFGDFRPIPLEPPTDLPANSFDLVYGISVFTHLREKTQFAWLEELRRITVPGAVLLLTIHGPTTIDYAGVPAEPFLKLSARVRREGFVITSSNSQIDDVIDEKDYYINVMHSASYIRETWGQYFEVVDIIPGFIYTHDMVVLRRRPM